MPREVTRVGPFPGRRGWLVIELDGRPWLGLPVETAAGLFVGHVLPDEEVAGLEAKARCADAVLRALRFLAPRPRSRGEVARRLRERGVPAEAVECALERLAGIGLIDDRAFAEWWVADRCEHRPRAARALRQELCRRGVDRAIVDDALQGLHDDFAAHALALARAGRYAGLDRETFDRRLGGYLARRGFGGEAVRRALDAAWQSVVDG